MATQPEDVRARAYILAVGLPRGCPEPSCSLFFELGVAQASARSPVSSRTETKLCSLERVPKGKQNGWVL